MTQGALRSEARCLRQLESLVAARYPVTYLLTHEERRALRITQQLARQFDLRFFTYSSASGLWQPFQQGAVPEEWQRLDPQGALQFVRDCPFNALFVFLDLHLYFGAPEVLRGLRDLALLDEEVHRHLVITAPVLQIPPELAKLATVVELELPTEDEIRDRVQEAMARLPVTLVARRPSPEELEQMVAACRGLTEEEYLGVLTRAWIENRFDPRAVLEEKRQIVRKSEILEFVETNLSFADVGGLSALKAWVDERRDVFSERARRYGLPVPRGLLLLGIPGTGKSLACKAIANEWGLPLLRLDMGRIFSGYIGSSEANMRKAIQVAEAVAPAVIWLDELEKGLSGAASSHESDAGTSARVLGTFLQWLNERTKPLFVVATANDIRELGTHHPELFRKGRFDEIFFVDLPTAAERQEIFRIHYQRPRELHPGGRPLQALDLEAISRATEGFSGSEIEHVVISGLFKAYRAGREPQTADFLEAARETHPLSATMREQIAYLREWAVGRARLARHEGLSTAG